MATMCRREREPCLQTPNIGSGIRRRQAAASPSVAARSKRKHHSAKLVAPFRLDRWIGVAIDGVENFWMLVSKLEGGTWIVKWAPVPGVAKFRKKTFKLPSVCQEPIHGEWFSLCCQGRGIGEKLFLALDDTKQVQERSHGHELQIQLRVLVIVEGPVLLGEVPVQIVDHLLAAVTAANRAL